METGKHRSLRAIGQQAPWRVSEAGLMINEDTDMVMASPESLAQKIPIVSSVSIAEVVEIGSSTLVLALDQTRLPAEEGIKVGELLVIESSTQALIGEVLSVQTALIRDVFEARATVELRATLYHQTGTISFGVSDAPIMGGHAYRPHPTVLRAVIEHRTNILENSGDELRLTFSRPAHYSDLDLTFSPEKIIGRHCAVLGTSGSGKSWTVARLVEECSKLNSKIFLIDPTGEYESLTGSVFHVHLGTATRDSCRSLEASLPYSQLTEADLIAIFRPTNGSQLLKLRAAMRTLKLLHHEPRLGTEGTMIKAHKSKVPYESAYQLWKSEVDKPENLFTIKKLPLQVEFECIDPIRSQTETNIWGGLNSHDHSSCIPLVNRIQDIFISEELRCIFSPSKQPSIFEVVKRFFTDPAISVLRISFEFLPTTHRTREIVANALGRFILARGRAGDFKENPLTIFLDEAHQALNSQLSDMSHEFPLEAFNIIAKEGRKYALTLCLATQRPRDIPDDVLSQVGTFIAHRLVHDADRGVIERATGAVKQQLLNDLPALGPGEAFLIGVDFPTPLRIKVLYPENPPFSRGPDYQTFWGRKRAEKPL